MPKDIVDLLQLGIGGVVAFGVLYLVFGFIKFFMEHRAGQPRQYQGNDNGATQRSALPSGKIEAIHELLTQKDLDGMPLIYTPRSLPPAIHELANAISEQNKMLIEQNKLLERLNTNVNEARNDLAKVAAGK